MQIEVFIELVRAVVPIIFILVILGGVLQIFRRKSMGSSNENFELEIGEEFQELERRVAEIRSGVYQLPTLNRFPDFDTDQTWHTESLNVEENEVNDGQLSSTVTTPTDNVLINFVQPGNTIGNRIDNPTSFQSIANDTNQLYSKPIFTKTALSSQLRSKDVLRQAILVSEILGRPKAFSELD